MNLINKTLVGIFVVLGMVQTEATAQVPGGVDTTGLGRAFWLKANSTAGITTDVTGTYVLAWKDEYSVYDVNQTSTAFAPLLLTTSVADRDFNFNPCVDFSPTSNRVLREYAAIPNFSGTTFSYFFVCNSISGNGSMITYRTSNNIRLQAKPRWRLQNGSNNIGYTSDFGTGANGPNNADFPGKAARVMSSIGIAGATDVRVNAKSYTINNSSSTYNPAISNGLILGANNTSEYYPDAMSELIIFPTQLDDGNANKVESYLAMKYGCTLDSGTTKSNYLLGDSTMIWPSANHPDYHHRITAIVRDDASDLYQKQSQSVHNESIVAAFYGAVPGSFPAMNDQNTSIIGDQQYMLFGDNDSSLDFGRCTASDYIAVMERTWLVRQSLNFNSSVTLRLEKDSVPPETHNLLVSADPSFPTTTTTVYPLTDDGTYLYATALLGDSLYFTFGTDSVQTTFTSTPAYCLSYSGTATATSTGGGGMYAYNWASSPPQTGASATGLLAGSTPVIVTHGVGCSVTENVAISSATYDLYVTHTVKDETCTNANGVLTLDANNSGVSPYLYSIDGGTNFVVTNIFPNLSAGGYPIQVTDQNGCSNVLYVAIVDNIVTPPDITYTITQPKCHGEPDASIEITAVSGATPHKYELPGLSLQNNTGKFDNLYADTYTFKITDANNCHLDTAITLSEPSEVNLQADVEESCWLFSTGRVTLTSYGGTPSYTYSTDGIEYSAENLIDSLAPGPYTFYTKDDHGCEDTLTISIGTYPVFTTSYTYSDVTCRAWNSGSIEITVQGSTGPYTYSWRDFPGEIIGASKDDLYAGTYHVEVQDANMCTDTLSITIDNTCCEPFVPTAFTPNGDGLNDRLEIQVSPDVQLQKFQIYNRFGQEIFYSLDPMPAWDGTYNGQLVDVDVYMWQATLICNGAKILASGDISLLR